MRSSGEISAEMNAVSSQITEIDNDMRIMYFDKLKMGTLCRQAKILKNDVKSYDISQEGEWEGNLYDDGVTYQSTAYSAAETVYTTLTTLQGELNSAYDIADQRKKDLQDRYDSLAREYSQALAEEQAAAERAAGY